MYGYRFGRFEMALDGRRLTVDGAEVELPYRQFEALRALLEAGGAAVDRDALHKQIWPDSLVDETSLNKCVSELRKTLADHDPETTYVETVRGRGYRMAALVEPISSGVQEAPASQSVGSGIGFKVACGLLAIAVAAVGWTAWERMERSRRVRDLRAEAERLYNARDYPQAYAKLREAAALDPDNGPIYSRLAHVVHKMKPGDVIIDDRTAVELAEKGAELAPDCGDCQGTLGFFLYYHAWEWKRAEEHLLKAFQLGATGASQAYPFLLAATGRTAEAVVEAEQAAEEFPLQAGRHAALAQVLYLDRRYEDAIVAANRAVSLDSTRKDAWEYRSRSQFQLGLVEEGVGSMIAERYKDHAEQIGAAVDEGGPDAGVRALLEVTGEWPERSTISWRRAAWFAALGEDDQALDALEEAVRIRNINMMFVAVDPIYENLRGRPRFHAVLEAMGLSDVKPAPPRELTAR